MVGRHASHTESRETERRIISLRDTSGLKWNIIEARLGLSKGSARRIYERHMARKGDKR